MCNDSNLSEFPQTSITVLQCHSECEIPNLKLFRDLSLTVSQYLRSIHSFRRQQTQKETEIYH